MIMPDSRAHNHDDHLHYSVTHYLQNKQIRTNIIHPNTYRTIDQSPVYPQVYWKSCTTLLYPSQVPHPSQQKRFHAGHNSHEFLCVSYLPFSLLLSYFSIEEIKWKK